VNVSVPRQADARMLTFNVAGERFGVPATLVREITRMPALTHVPHAPSSLLGLGNFRGVVLPVVSFARATGRPKGTETKVILLDTANPVALAVDAISTLETREKVQAIDTDALVRTDGARPASLTRRIARAASEALPRESEVALIAFLVGGQEYALPIGGVDEILTVSDAVTVLPHGDAVVVGSVAVRDALLPLLSLQRLLGLEGVSGRLRPRVVVTRIGKHRVGLVVDVMRGVIRVAESYIDPVPPVLARGTAEARIQAICRMDGGKRLVSVLAVEHLIREDLTARLLETGEAQTMAASPSDAGETEQFLIFRIAETDFALPIAAVVEVTAVPDKLGRMPKAPAFVQGFMTLRGKAVPVIDQSLRFIGMHSNGARRRVIVVQLGALVAGFIVDAVAEVQRIAITALSDAPDLGNSDTRVFDRVAMIDGEKRIVLVVSPQELLDRAERDLLSAIDEKTPADTL
jgi:purine-binding chemotaxis protein CheW